MSKLATSTIESANTARVVASAIQRAADGPRGSAGANAFSARMAATPTSGRKVSRERMPTIAQRPPAEKK